MCLGIVVLASPYTYRQVMCISRVCIEIDKIFWISFIANANFGNISESKYKNISYTVPLANEIILM